MTSLSWTRALQTYFFRCLITTDCWVQVFFAMWSLVKLKQKKTTRAARNFLRILYGSRYGFSKVGCEMKMIGKAASISLRTYEMTNIPRYHYTRTPLFGMMVDRKHANNVSHFYSKYLWCLGKGWHHRSRGPVQLWDGSSVPFATVSAIQFFEHLLDAWSANMWYFSVVTHNH